MLPAVSSLIAFGGLLHRTIGGELYIRALKNRDEDEYESQQCHHDHSQDEAVVEHPKWSFNASSQNATTKPQQGQLCEQ